MEQFLERVGAVKRPQAEPAVPVSLVVATQDWKHLTADVSCHTPTPLQIGQKRYAKGLGAHANGTIVFQLHAPFASFFADIGVDVNPDTEGCASGGRRIDLETIRRAHTFWKSDDTVDLPVLRFHQTGANTFLPGGLLNANVLPANLEFDVHSVYGGPLGLRCDWAKLSAAERQGLARLIQQYKQVRRLLNGDFVPLFSQSRKEDGWVGWQFQAPGGEEGLVVLLRPPSCAYCAADARLHGLAEAGSYRISPLGLTPSNPATLSGKQLLEGWPVQLPNPAISHVFTYKRLDRD